MQDQLPNCSLTYLDKHSNRPSKDDRQGEKRGTLQFQNYSENTYGIFRTLYTHALVQKLPQTCTHLTDIQYVLVKSHGRFEIIIQLTQGVASDGRYNICELRPQLWQTQHKHRVFYVATQTRSCMELSLVILASTYTTNH